MPEAYYIIPIVPPPYSVGHGERPAYVDEIRCNWTGHPAPDLGVYVCKVNTTEAKHAALAASAGVRQLPPGVTWTTIISTLKPAQRTAISNWCNNKGIPYDSAETIGDLLLRIIASGLFTFGATALTTQFQNLNQTQQDKLTAICRKWGLPDPTNAETIKQLSKRMGQAYWPANHLTVEEY
jgi:hypothetical protein